MKIAFFQPYLANWRIDYLDFFIREYKGGSVIVYDGGFGGKNDTKSVSGNIPSFTYKKLFSSSPVFSYKNQEYPFFFSPFLIFNLIKDRPDIIITEGEINFVNNFFIYLYCLLFKKKYIWWSLGKVRTRKKNVINVILDPFIDFLLFRASCVMARNTLAKSYYIHEKFIPKEKVIVAPNSMNHHKEVLPKSSTVELLTSLKGNSTVMLYVGALTSTKRPADLIYSLKHILNLNPYSDLKLWFVGDGPEKNALEQLVQDLSLVNNVNFFGKIFDGVGAYFQVSDFVVVPGLGGLVINHAMIYGKPVISRLADGTELDLVLDGVTGFIVDDYNLENLADKIILMINSDLGLMSKNCKLLVSDTWNIDIMFLRNLDCIYFKGN